MEASRDKKGFPRVAATIVGSKATVHYNNFLFPQLFHRLTVTSNIDGTLLKDLTNYHGGESSTFGEQMSAFADMIHARRNPKVRCAKQHFPKYGYTTPTNLAGM